MYANKTGEWAEAKRLGHRLFFVSFFEQNPFSLTVDSLRDYINRYCAEHSVPQSKIFLWLVRQ